MFRRSVIKELNVWLKKKNRKPLVIRGARQVGKTTAVHQFAEQFEQYIYLNLEIKSDRRLFEQHDAIEELVKAIFFLKNKSFTQRKKTLLFIDEIQEQPIAIAMLRYFHEHFPEIAVIAAGSLLETLFDNDLSFPVGRVEYLIIRPVSFKEFLNALGENTAIVELEHIPLNTYAGAKLQSLFHTYALVGGMPEIVQHFAETGDIQQLQPIYNSLVAGYLDDVEKYTATNNQLHIIRHVMRASFAEAGKRIKYQGFGKSNYGSREIGEAFRALQKAMLLQLIHPTTGTTLPITPELQKSPRLHLLDTGLVNFMSGIQKDIIGTKDLSGVYNGTVIEHLIGQEILADNYSVLSSLNFWVREKNTSTAEIDYVIQYDGMLIPIEVKSGKTGKLKSLQLFMNNSTSMLAVRCYAGALSIDTIVTPEGKEFQLLNLPYYLVSQLPRYIEWSINHNLLKKSKKKTR
jgi:predicted AAA+ superfamily ATPase